ncbi:uncharacterized protein LOC116247252 isoform X2 [Nymphaea colorata]|uniref:uncharacterized protein LOC116247252 isoform X2 n=1 Tax=Nymphaea colorata TaxID=210225 RepID=UPI00129E9875|nr:uncharacterized protein LOC116247252 isoform X2 [Nymphaea colorata]
MEQCFAVPSLSLSLTHTGSEGKVWMRLVGIVVFQKILATPFLPCRMDGHRNASEEDMENKGEEGQEAPLGPKPQGSKALPKKLRFFEGPKPTYTYAEAIHERRREQHVKERKKKSKKQEKDEEEEEEAALVKEEEEKKNASTIMHKESQRIHFLPNSLIAFLVGSDPLLESHYLPQLEEISGL